MGTAGGTAGGSVELSVTVICFNLLAVCIYYFLYHLMASKDCRVVDLLLN